MNLINFKDLTDLQLVDIINTALEVKDNPEKYESALSGRSLAMVFQKTSTRTRMCFEVSMTQLGGHAIYMDWRTSNFTIADVYDETQYMSRNTDCILARLKKNADLQVMADASKVPVINGCDEKYHPSQVIADLMTIKEKMGTLKRVKIVYIGIHNNVCNSLVEGCTKTGVKIVTVSPIFNEPSRDDELLSDARKTGLYETTKDAKSALTDADFVYTDTWIDMEFLLEPKYAKEKKERLRTMMPYQINKELLGESNPYIMHDMPIHRGYEISEDTIESPKSLIYEQSENRLYSAKAILLKLIR